MRRIKLMVAIVGAAVVIAVVIVFAAGAAAGRHPTSSAPGPTFTSRSHEAGRQHGSGRLSAVSPAIGLRRGVTSPVAAGFAAAMAAVPNLSVAQLAGQRVIYSYKGLTPPAALLRLISHGEAAGVIFFGDNVGGPGHLAQVAASLEKAAASPVNPLRNFPLLLMTDQEGGIVRRLPGAPVMSEKQVGESAHPATAAAKAGAGAAANLRGHGLNLNLAPVLDVYRQPGNFIDQYQRSYSSNPGVVAKLGQAFIEAQQRRGVAATVKHFPGLGAAATKQNTDAGPVTLNLTLQQIRSIDEVPYTSAIAAKVKLVMASWAIYPALDPGRPAGLSKKIVQGELRKRLGFGGVTITDSMSAGALNPFGPIGSRATLASRAGMDLMLCAGQDVGEGQGALAALEAAFRHDTAAGKAAFKAAAERVIALRQVLGGG